MRSRFTFGNRKFEVDLVEGAEARVCIGEGESQRTLALPQGLSGGAGRVLVGARYLPWFISESPKVVWVTIAGQTFVFEKARSRDRHVEDLAQGFAAPMPGRILQVTVTAGQEVLKGDPLVLMEAMKMEHRIEAPATGRVSEVFCAPGDVVEQGFVLLAFEPTPPVA